MTLQKQISLDLKKAILSKSDDEKNILRVVIGEFNRQGKDISDEAAISTIKKMVENATQQGNREEVLILEKYLPKQIDDVELKKIVLNYFETLNRSVTMKDMGGAMNFLKQNYGGKYDGKTASNLIKELINS